MKKLFFAAALLLLGMAAGAQETNYAKSDFVPGDEIIFDDPVEKEKLGEFPSHWDFLAGEECEIVNHKGMQAIKLSGWYSEIGPLMKKADYLPEEFTVEFDVWSNATLGYSDNEWIRLELYSEQFPDGIVRVDLNPAVNDTPGESDHANLVYSFQPPTGDSREGSAKGALLDPLIKANTRLHVAAPFYQRAFN